MMMAQLKPVAANRPKVLISAGEPSCGRWGNQLAGLLQATGVAIEWAQSGPETIEIVETGRVNVAVLGTKLPGMDGLSVLRIIRSTGADLPCVLVAPKASKRLLERALDLDAYSVLTTPVDTRLMRTVMARIFHKFFESDLLV